MLAGALHADLCLPAQPDGDLVQPHHLESHWRGTFSSVKHLNAKIDHFVQYYKPGAESFVWTATADSIIAKLERLCELISGIGHCLDMRGRR